MEDFDIFLTATSDVQVLKHNEQLIVFEPCLTNQIYRMYVVHVHEGR